MVPVKGGVGAGRLKGFGVITASGAPGVPRICCAPAPALASQKLDLAKNEVLPMLNLVLGSYVYGLQGQTNFGDAIASATVDAGVLARLLAWAFSEDLVVGISPAAPG